MLHRDRIVHDMNNDNDTSSFTIEPATPKTIMIVEDDANVGEVLMQAVAEETIHRAHLVSTGQKAIELVKTIHPALFILDYHLPLMNGLELYDRLHEIEGLEQVPTILTTAGVMEHNIEGRHLVGISKPIDMNKLLDMIEEFLD
jgi:CheY-like chemotaxis protein